MKRLRVRAKPKDPIETKSHLIRELDPEKRYVFEIDAPVSQVEAFAKQSKEPFKKMGLKVIVVQAGVLKITELTTGPRDAVKFDDAVAFMRKTIPAIDTASGSTFRALIETILAIHNGELDPC